MVSVGTVTDRCICLGACIRGYSNIVGQCDWRTFRYGPSGQILVIWIVTAADGVDIVQTSIKASIVGAIVVQADWYLSCHHRLSPGLAVMCVIG